MELHHCAKEYIKSPCNYLTLTMDIKQGKAAVCHGSYYVGKFLLIKDKKTQKLAQLFAELVIPCSEHKNIVLNEKDTHDRLGWNAGTNSSDVEMSAADYGYKFIE
jgi:hypothetical protein